MSSPEQTDKTSLHHQDTSVEKLPSEIDTIRNSSEQAIAEDTILFDTQTKILDEYQVKPVRRVQVTYEMFANEESFAAAYELLRQPLLHFIHTFNISTFDAEDVLHESLVRARTYMTSYDASKGSFPTWLFTVTANYTKDYIRRIERRPKAAPNSEYNGEVMDDKASDENVEEIVLFNARAEKLRDVIRLLRESSPDQMQVIELTLQGKTQTEIAEIIGKPVGTVKTRVRLGMQKLKYHLKDEQDFLLD